MSSAAVSVANGAKGDSSMLTQTNSSEPPKIIALIAMGQTKLKPDACM